MRVKLRNERERERNVYFVRMQIRNNYIVHEMTLGACLGKITQTQNNISLHLAIRLKPSIKKESRERKDRNQALRVHVDRSKEWRGSLEIVFGSVTSS